MAKFNAVQKKKRAQVAERKRATKGDPHTRKLKTKPQQQSLSVSGKRKRKLLKKWRREHKEAVQKGLLTIQDVEMAVADGESQDAPKTSAKFSVKKSLKLRQLKRKGGKNKRKSSSNQPAAEVSVDAMVE
ncbi:uncharacterized protein LOC125421298 [Ziziphus jujuba]|uniref:Uncharacterized protein LOC125421298 n=1 Tax=Ziziphus jujuba TaxID=326968 RepID=A0ABM3ICZ8_ZIZJJ|nr:uncharacterized protein LOC125421298 [Ziziphus jujuba]